MYRFFTERGYGEVEFPYALERKYPNEKYEAHSIIGSISARRGRGWRAGHFAVKTGAVKRTRLPSEIRQNGNGERSQ